MVCESPDSALECFPSLNPRACADVCQAPSAAQPMVSRAVGMGPGGRQRGATRARPHSLGGVTRAPGSSSFPSARFISLNLANAATACAVPGESFRTGLLSERGLTLLAVAPAGRPSLCLRARWGQSGILARQDSARAPPSISLACSGCVPSLFPFLSPPSSLTVWPQFLEYTLLHFATVFVISTSRPSFAASSVLFFSHRHHSFRPGVPLYFCAPLTRWIETVSSSRPHSKPHLFSVFSLVLGLNLSIHTSYNRQADIECA